jgi:radical SAM superfamily enzyme YgiQ (UPF0313 family)
MGDPDLIWDKIQAIGMATPSIKLAFINLRARTKDWHHIIMVPLGIMALSAAVKKAFGDRIEVRLFDCTTHPEHEEPDEAIRKFLEEFRPAVVGIRGFSSQADEFPIVARIAKEVDPKVVVLAGGPHASTNSPSLYKIKDIDYVAPYEGDEVLVEVLENVMAGRSNDGVMGLGRGDADGQPLINPARPQIKDLDTLPFPDYDVINLDAYQGRLAMTDFLTRRKFTSLFTSRGCYYACSYCHTNFGKRMRYRSVNNVLDEIQSLVEQRGVGEFHIIDDIFNADRERAMGIFEGVVRRGLDVNFAFPNGLRADLMDEEFIAAARAAGTYTWALAVESASPRIQKQVRKFNKLDKVFQAIEWSDKHGIFTCTFNMLGFPTETEEEMRMTLDFNMNSKAHFTHFFVVTPYEGTSMYDTLERFGINISDLDPEQLGYQVFSGSDEHSSISRVPRSKIQSLIVEGVQRFYFDPVRLARMMELNHNHVHLALHVETRRWSAGYDWNNMPSPETARLLARLYADARAADAARCAHLPEPPAALLAETLSPA